MKIIKTLLLLLLGTYSLSSYGWYDTNAFNTAPDWQYRVPIVVPATAPVNSTVKFDVDFNALLATLGVAGTFDINSPRIVRPNETLAATQEYTDRVYNGVLDAASNSRGEVKFILQDAGPATYHLYFDITANGVKSTNPNPTINGNFEHSTGVTPTNWNNTSDLNAGGAQNNETYDTNYGSSYSSPGGAPTCLDQAISSADTSPNNTGSAASTTGRKWHLLGYRNNCEDGPTGGGAAREHIRISRNITIPATNPGSLTFYFHVQAFDNYLNTTQYDFFQLSMNGANVDHSTLGIANPANRLRINAFAFGRRNGFSPNLIDAGWQLATLNLNSYAGQTITVRFDQSFFIDNTYRSWIKLDDIEWSIQTATLGAPEILPLPNLSMQKVSQVISDGINASNPKRIPGAIVEYTITATNSGSGATDNNTVVINDAIPATTEYVVNSLQFIDGSPVSGLTEIPVATTYRYSTDGTTYNTTQSTAVTHVRVLPIGQFLGSNGSGDPSFQIKFRVQVK